MLFVTVVIKTFRGIFRDFVKETKEQHIAFLCSDKPEWVAKGSQRDSLRKRCYKSRKLRLKSKETRYCVFQCGIRAFCRCCCCFSFYVRLSTIVTSKTFIWCTESTVGWLKLLMSLFNQTVNFTDKRSNYCYEIYVWSLTSSSFQNFSQT